uniref:Ubiquitin interaction domain-containing protein n=1 Tax=Pyricularia oryzae (strain P131) TaxID=1143193 RepID=L7JFM9_PYRO1
MAEEENLQTVCDFTGSSDTELMRRALRAKNNDVQAVISEYFESTEKFVDRYSYSEAPFQADRNGSYNQDGNFMAPTFMIQGPDDGGAVLHGVPPSVPPSRPPSRSDNRSPMSRMMNWASENAGAPTTRAQEDADYQRALAESRASSGLEAPPQESGVVGANGQDVYQPFFGPAVRDNYEQAQWAMVPVAQEKPDPLPSDRKRNQGIPPFLRCRRTGSASEQHRLGALLTILHQIPAARNFFLELEAKTGTYGINNQWWKGEAIPPAPREDQQEAIPDDGGWHESQSDGPPAGLVEELHRLMAFLDMTDRSYGQADVLADLVRDSTYQSSSAVELKLFEIMQESINIPSDVVRNVFWSIETYRFAVPVQEHVCDEAFTFGIIDLNLSSAAYAKMESLYDAWDELLWIDAHSAENEESLRTAAVTKPGDVLAMNFSGEGELSPSRPVDIPAVFYVDRYLAENVEGHSMEQQLRIRQERRVLAELEERERLETQWWSPEEMAWRDRIALSEKVIEDRVEKEKALKFKVLRRRWFECVDTPDYFHFIPGWMDDKLAFSDAERAKLKQWQRDRQFHEGVIADIKNKKQEYTRIRSEAHAEIKRWTQRFSVPCPEDNWEPVHMYHLRGVATSPNTMYLAQRAEPDLIEMDGNPAPTDQWWKLSYVAEDRETPLRIATSSIDEARKAAYTESTRPILVYANDSALETMPKQLSEALRTFVKFDNRVFKQELIEQTPDTVMRSPPALPARSNTPLQQQPPSLVSFSTDSLPGANSRDIHTSSKEVFPGRSDGAGDLPTVEMTEVRMVDQQDSH